MVGKIQWLFLGLLIEFSNVYRIVKLGSLKKGCYEELYLVDMGVNKTTIMQLKLFPYKST